MFGFDEFIFVFSFILVVYEDGLGFWFWYFRKKGIECLFVDVILFWVLNDLYLNVLVRISFIIGLFFILLMYMSVLLLVVMENLLCICWVCLKIFLGVNCFGFYISDCLRNLG